MSRFSRIRRLQKIIGATLFALGVAWINNLQSQQPPPLSTGAESSGNQQTGLAGSSPQAISSNQRSTTLKEEHVDLVTWIIAGATLAQFIALAVTVFVMTRTARKQLRAYIHPDSPGVMEGTGLVPPRADKVNEPGIWITFKNTGATPAYGVVSWAQVAFGRVEDEDHLLIPELNKAFAAPLAPGGTITKFLWSGHALSPNEIDDVQSGRGAIYLYGRVDYRDIFGSKPRPSSRFGFARTFHTSCFPHCALKRKLQAIE